MSFTGSELRQQNDEIVQCISKLKSQSEDLNLLIQKQTEEKVKLQTEIERITYKLAVLNRSLCKRIETKASYDRTISKAESEYAQLLTSTKKLAITVCNEVNDLDQIMNKKTSADFDKIQVENEDPNAPSDESSQTN